MRRSHSLFLVLIYALLYLPLVVLVALSFNDSAHSSLWHGFTWHWYQQLVNDQTTLRVAWHSLLIASLSASIATVMGALAGVVLFRYRFFGRQSLRFSMSAYIILPDLVIAIGLLLLYHYLQLPLGFTSLLLAHITFSLPFAFLVVSNRLKELNPFLFEAARDLSASEWQIVWRVVTPLLASQLAAAWLLCFTLSLDDVVISYFVTGPDFQTLPLHIYASIKLGVTPEINALCTIILVATLILGSLCAKLAKEPL